MKFCLPSADSVIITEDPCYYTDPGERTKDSDDDSDASSGSDSNSDSKSSGFAEDDGQESEGTKFSESFPSAEKHFSMPFADLSPFRIVDDEAEEASDGHDSSEVADSQDEASQLLERLDKSTAAPSRRVPDSGTPVFILRALTLLITSMVWLSAGVESEHSPAPRPRSTHPQCMSS